MAQKYYAIKEGFDKNKKQKIENALVYTWDECKRLVVGVKGAKYKSFESLDEAKEYLKDEIKLLKKGIDTYPEEYLHIYVDGSYHSNLEKYSYAFVAVKNGTIVEIEYNMSEDSSQKSIRQIAGELKGVARGLAYAVSAGEKQIVLFHDYEGIFHHAVGTWARNDDSSKAYYEQVNALMKTNNLEVIFVKVDSHTGDFYNELTDSFAKLALGIKPTFEVEKWLNSNVLHVANKQLSEKINNIVSGKSLQNVKIIENDENSIIEQSDYHKTISIIQQKAQISDEEVFAFIKQLDTDYKDNIIAKLVLNK